MGNITTDRRLIPALLALLLTAVLPAAGASADALQDEIQHYAKVFDTGSVVAQRQAINELEWLGISDPRLYDVIERKVLAGYMTESDNEVEHLSWLVKTLGFSGQKKYLPTIQKVIDSAKASKLKKHANRALGHLESHAQWNPVISKNVAGAGKGRIDEIRVTNMLESDDISLMRVAARRIGSDLSNNKQVLDMSAKILRSGYNKNTKDREYVDLMALLCKALAASGNKEYRPVLEEVVQNTSNRKLKKYAQQSLDAL